MGTTWLQNNRVMSAVATGTISTAIYQRRLDERNRALEHWTKRDRRVADARLVSFVAALVSGHRDLPRPRA